MQKILVDLNRHLVQLNLNISQFFIRTYDKQLRRLVEKAITRITKLFFDVYDAIEHWKVGKVSELALEFLEEVDYLLDLIASKLPLKKVERYTHITRELVQVVRTYIVFLDQQRQEHFAF